MPIIGIAVLALDIFTIIHVLRHRRQTWWILCILLFPFLGSVFYFLYEVAPGSREQRAALKIGSDIVKSIAPDKELWQQAVRPNWQTSLGDDRHERIGQMLRRANASGCAVDNDADRFDQRGPP